MSPGGDVIRAFRRNLAEEVALVHARSDAVRLTADPTSGDPAAVYHGLFRRIDRFERTPDGSARRCTASLPFSLVFPDDYCSATDGTLGLRVARVHAPLLHPNVSATGVVCLGPGFRPSTRLRPLLEHLHRICTSRVWANESPFDAAGVRFYRSDPARVRALRSPALWREPAAARVRVEAVSEDTR